MYKALLQKKKWKNLGFSQEGGFSMVDLMVGAGLTMVLVAGSGGAIASMLDSSTTANAKSERRVEMNRALDFITTEVNRSSNLVQTPTLPTGLVNKLAEVSSEIDVSSVTPVLQLNLPGGSDPVTYFTATPKSGTWKGPKVLFRWGANFDQAGTYIDPANSANWKPLALLDRLDTFSASVSGDSVQLKPVGQIQKLLGRTESYQITSNASTKNKRVAPPSFQAVGGAGASIAKLFTITNGNVIVDQASTLKVEFLGGDITCGAGGPTIPTLAKVNVSGESNSGWISPTGTLSYDVSPSTTLNIEGWAKGNNSSGGCKNHNMKFNSEGDQGSQVLTLVDGDTVPEFRPLPGQRTIDTFLEPYIDSTTGKVSIAPNEVIFLFEMGTTNSGSQAYDMQDMVVLATISPTNTSTSSSSSPSTTSSSTTSGSTTSSSTTSGSTTSSSTTSGSTTSGSTTSGSTTSGSITSGSSNSSETSSNPGPTPNSNSTTSSSKTQNSSSNQKCNNGLGNGSENCTPGNARPNDEIVRDALGNVICTPAPGNPCTQASKSVGGNNNKKK
ncbi:PulJ/GspJ family protein [Lyngbya confervoides]|uniref:Uncharacterized protein n=1 Tax=Lyngbya confervoides BDU141951 TaxID=1574623 RepID=A0ABD4SX92_9CYAN|nr:hypothetical protein [Lyngbya confervoides]MCM1981287.1 hypothetical protein [Lyngbya confervoides BDU141951]